MARRWFELAAHEEQPPFDGPVPPFRSFRARWEQRGDQLLAETGVRGAGRLVADRHNDLLARAPLYPEVSEVLPVLEAEYPVGILSDADREHLDPSLERAQLSHLTALCSEDLRIYKPHIEGFLAACERLGTQPSQTLFVGDSPRNDIDGARRAGLQTAWINRHNMPWPDRLAAAKEIATLSELPSRLV